LSTLTNPPQPPHQDIAPVGIEEEMKRSYLDYAMSVIVSRALPDVRDGLKPVHRRILYAMNESGYDWNKAPKKSARIVGDVMGNYHPHGDSAIYDAMVRMAQDFSMRVPLVQGQGNFGSMDGDPPAAMRYTEVRLAKVSNLGLLQDIEKDTVDFQPNYDESTKEPVVLPARFPNLLVNGAGGIAVGMATNIPTHNLGEVIDACLAYLEDPALSAESLMQHIPGPDFPTGGIILGRQGIRDAYKTGRGSIVMRARCHVEEIRKDREAIIVTEVPYQVNKARLMERIAELVQDKQIEGISDLRDESNRDGVRMVIELKRDASSDVVLNQLYRYTALQTSFGVNMLALNQGRPELLNLRQVIASFITFREEVIRRRTVFDLGKARERAHILAGLALAVANIDEVIALIRRAPDPVEARQQLMAREWPAGDVAPLIRLIDEPGHKVSESGTYKLSETQARAILELRLQRLTGLERDKISEELDGLVKLIAEYVGILESREKLIAVLRGELVEVRDEFATARKTTLEEAAADYDVEDLIEREDMVVTVTHGGYIKRTPLSTYRAQRRGGKGRAGMAMRDDDFVNDAFVANTHTPILFFSSRGIVYKMKVFRLPLGTPTSRGKAMVNILPLSAGEVISTVMPLPEDEDSWGDLNVVFATSKGTVRRNRLSDFTNVMANGKIAMKLEDDAGNSLGRLVSVRTCSEDQDLLIAAHSGKCIRFRVGDIRLFSGRNSIGVRGIRLSEEDELISMSILNHVEVETEERESYLKAAIAKRRAAGLEGDEGDVDDSLIEKLGQERFNELEEKEEFLLTVTENGFGKRSSAYDYRLTGRGGQGIANIETTERNGPVAASFPVMDSDHIMLVTDMGQIIRCPVHDIRIAARKTQGVKLFHVSDEEKVVSVARLEEAEEEDISENVGDHEETDLEGSDEGPSA